MFAGQEREASIGLGVVSLFISILNTTGSYFGWAKRQEGHRISNIQYSRLYRFLLVELGLPREERKAPQELLKYVREQYDRLQEISPLIPEPVAKQFKERFGSVVDIQKPEELNGLDPIQIYPSILTNASTPSHPTIQLGAKERVASIFERDTPFSETSRSGTSNSTSRRFAEGREGEGHTSIPVERDGHEEGHTNP